MRIQLNNINNNSKNTNIIIVSVLRTFILLYLPYACINNVIY